MAKKTLKSLFLGFIFSILIFYVGIYGLVILPIEIIFKPLLLPGILLLSQLFVIEEFGSMWKLWLIVTNGIIYSIAFFVISSIRRKF